MTRLQRVLLRQSELRTELAGLLDLETRSEEQQTRREKIVFELRALERDIRDARLAERDPEPREEPRTDPAERELLELRSRFRVARVINAHLGKAGIDGPEAELCAELNVNAGEIPVSVFERREETAPLETRAVSPSSALTNVGRTQAPIVPAIFDRSIAGFLGIEMPSAGVGDQAFPVLSSNVEAGVRAKDAAGPETAADVKITSVEPRGITGSFRFRLEDAARLVGLEDALRMNLSQVLSDQVDNQALNGAEDSDGKLKGLLAELGAPAAAEGAALATWAIFNKSFADAVDGLFAVNQSGVAGLVGTKAYSLMQTVFRASESNESASAYLDRVAGGVRVSRRFPAVTSKKETAVLRRNNPMGDRLAVMPFWDTIQIRDVYSGAASRQVVVTASMLVGSVVVLRKGAYKRVDYQVTA